MLVRHLGHKVHAEKHRRSQTDSQMDKTVMVMCVCICQTSWMCSTWWRSWGRRRLTWSWRKWSQRWTPPTPVPSTTRTLSRWCSAKIQVSWKSESAPSMSSGPQPGCFVEQILVWIYILIMQKQCKYETEISHFLVCHKSITHSFVLKKRACLTVPLHAVWNYSWYLGNACPCFTLSRPSG